MEQNVDMINDRNTSDGNRQAMNECDEKTLSSANIWKLPMSEVAKNTLNPIRQICDSSFVTSNTEKPLLKLNLGDPTVSGALPECPAAIQAISEALTSRKYEGYGPAIGILEAREAIARHFTHPEAPVTADSVLLTSGCSHAIEMAIEVLANPGDNILVPAPGFSLYSTLLKSANVESRYYYFDILNGPQLDLAQLKSLIDNRTRAIIINNPPNPIGIPVKKQIPIIADEVYGTMTYNGAEFYPIATLKPKVPILTCDGIAKRYLLPGWRLGWIIVHDRYAALQSVRDGLIALAQKIVGPCVLIQGALPRILQSTNANFFQQVNSIIHRNASIVCKSLSEVPGLQPLRPNGTMYMMVGIDEQMYGSDRAFVRDLFVEENVICLPGYVFHCAGWFRLVLTCSEHDTHEACTRIVQFCLRRCSHSLNHETSI
ncbi:tyrosine aminotransferase [Loa loa]|uniref:Tyrosine aminotransferase n=1 Tax=Loa loa TaxID=7209 RepID=A0A1S0U5P9_LOALO|nr:tyrosine aminotransferase [Loa loa]EFO25263.1 tyrosine aminotransferase [Loa loa]